MREQCTGERTLIRNKNSAEAVMKPLWTQALAWIVAVVAAVLLAFASPAGLGFFDGEASHGASTPR